MLTPGCRRPGFARATRLGHIAVLMALASPAMMGALSDRVVAYRMRVQLDPARKTITGHESLDWRNTSPDTVRELRFHLYLNAFQNEKSTFMRESGGQLRGDRVQKDGWGYIEIRRMQVAGGADLTSGIRFVHPDDGNADDQTVISVPLQQPVSPGQTVTLEIDFLSKLPKVFARTGFHNDFYMAGQWFPKIGVYEKAGDRYAATGAWNCHQFHADTEFYADYGTYDVSLTVPADYVVGATGVEQSRTVDAQRRQATYRFYQEDVHDFAWTASPRFVRIERLFDPARAVTPADIAATAKLVGVRSEDLRLKPVRMILLIQPEHRWQTDRHFRTLENGIKWFGLWYGAYPYDTITMVDPPHGAAGAGGMEYPTLITAGTSWWPGAHTMTPEEVIIHEFGHQYWYGMVGSNEFEESWLDEGFNTYSTGKIIDKVYGPQDLPINILGFPVSRLLGLPQFTEDAISRVNYLEFAKHDPVIRNGWQYYGTSSYAINSYMRPATLLRTMENYLGAPVMARIMRAWFERYRFHHPTTTDFLKLVNQISARDMTWYFDQFVYGTNRLNYKVASVECEPVGVKLGSFTENGKRKVVSDADAERIQNALEKKKGYRQPYRIEVRLTREGETVLPVAMKMTLDNGEVVREQWDGRDRWVKYEYTKTSTVKSVEIDPEGKVLLDDSFADNSYLEKPPVRPFAKWSSNLLFWLQMVLP